jgi:hypothetical protein
MAMGRTMGATGRPRRRRINIWVWLLLPLVLIFALPAVILCMIGLLPTVVAAVIDRREEKYAAYCVGGFNLAGTLPWFLEIFPKGGMEGLMSVLINPFAWLVMYGLASVGWAVFYYIPQVTIRIQMLRDRQLLSGLRRRQQAIVDEWGPEVATGETFEEALQNG